MAKSKLNKRKNYTLAFKLRVIQYAECKKNISKAARKYKVDRKMVRRWIKNKDVYLKAKNKRFRQQVC